MCKRVMGVSQELGRSCRLHGMKRRKEWPSNEQNTPGLRPWHLGPPGANAGAAVVPPSEGNEARREGRQDVLVPS